MLVASWELGIAGLAAGFLAGRAILTVAYPWLVSRHFGLSLRGQAAGALRPLLVCAALFAAATLASPAADTNSWAVLLAGAALSLAVLAPASFLLGLTRRQRRRLSARVRRVVQPA